MYGMWAVVHTFLSNVELSELYGHARANRRFTDFLRLASICPQKLYITEVPRMAGLYERYVLDRSCVQHRTCRIRQIR